MKRPDLIASLGLYLSPREFAIDLFRVTPPGYLSDSIGRLVIYYPHAIGLYGIGIIGISQQPYSLRRAAACRGPGARAGGGGCAGLYIPYFGLLVIFTKTISYDSEGGCRLDVGLCGLCA